MKNWVIGLIVLSISIVSALMAVLYKMEIGWLQAIVTFFAVYGMALIFLAAVLRGRQFKKDPEYRPFCSLIVPARNEEKVIADTIRSLMNIDYSKDNKPNYEVIVMDDNSSDRTLEIANALKDEFPGLKVVHRNSDIAGKGKSDVLNHGLKEAKGDIIGVFDADTRVARDFLQKTVPLMADPQVGGVQGRVRLYNRNKNILTMLQEDEFAVVVHLYQIGKEYIGGITALGGNGQIVKREAVESVGGWNYYSPTEDLDLTFRLLFKGWDIRYAPDAVIWQEGVEKPYAFLRQRVRWAEGFLKCIFDYSVPLIFGKSTKIKKIDGIMTMGRVFIPVYIWISYIFAFFATSQGLSFTTSTSQALMGFSAWIFTTALLVGMWKVLYPNPFMALLRVFMYSFYGSLWVLVIPLGFINCFRRIDDICWDKTIHSGSTTEEDNLTGIASEEGYSVMVN